MRINQILNRFYIHDLVDSIIEFKDFLINNGATVIRDITEVPTGINMTVKHFDGTIVEYVEHKNKTGNSEVQVMKIIAFNGSPRKNWNTAALLNHALEGATSHGAETELIHLYDYHYKGCISCFSCKLKEGKSYGRCAAKDDLTPILNKVEDADAIILGSPIYLGAVTGEMKAFLERLIFPYLVYDANHSTLFKKKIPTGFIYTLGATENRMKDMGFDQPSRVNEMLLKMIFGASESLFVTDTYQFDDYSKYVTSINEEEKAKRRKEQFPIDCQKAFGMGAGLAQSVHA